MGSYNPVVIFNQLPGFTISGLLPPYVGADPTIQHLTSPYPTTVEVQAQHFSISPKRGEILRGFLAFRQALANLGDEPRCARGLWSLPASFDPLVSGLADSLELHACNRWPVAMRARP